MDEIWIIGMGQFGLLALQRLSSTKKDRHFVLVDPVEKNLLQCQNANCTLEQADGVDFLNRRLEKGNAPDWIIPALPIHLAAEWFLTRLGPERIRRIPLPRKIEALLPNPMRGSDGNIYVSHANFRCPDDCAEPRDLCTVTGEPRKQNMFGILRTLQVPSFQSFVIRSLQLGPGIGGYRPEQLFELLKELEHTSGQCIVSTACRCHGVITGVERF